MAAKPKFGTKKKPKAPSYIEERLAAYIHSRGLPRPVRQHKFDPTRKWSLDFAWPAIGVALEVEGAVFVQGRHTSGAGLVRDVEKYNAAADLGWIVYRCTTMNLRDGSIFLLLDRLGAQRPAYSCGVLL